MIFMSLRCWFSTNINQTSQGDHVSWWCQVLLSHRDSTQAGSRDVWVWTPGVWLRTILQKTWMNMGFSSRFLEHLSNPLGFFPNILMIYPTWKNLDVAGFPPGWYWEYWVIQSPLGFSHGSTRLGNPGRRVANARSAAGGIRDTPIYGHGKSGEKVWKSGENGRNHGCLAMKVREVLNLETTPGT